MKYYFLSVLIVVSLISCTEDKCGNGVIDGNEECDSNYFPGKSCQGLGYYGGALKCTSSCKIDYSDCEDYGKCGDGILQEDREICEGEEFIWGSEEYGTYNNCSAIGYGQTYEDKIKKMPCNEYCRVDISECVSDSVCGDGILEAPERCDGESLTGLTCADFPNFDAGELKCSSDCLFNTSGCFAQECGNGVVTGNEQCDTGNLLGKSCSDFGLHGEGLKCTKDCRWDFSLCEGDIECGDGVITGSEECEGSEDLGITCEIFGYAQGTITCNSECQYEIDCRGTCGDGIISPDESCDGSKLNGHKCGEFGFFGGELSCSNCEFDTSNCVGAQKVFVGNNSVCATTKNNQIYCWGYNGNDGLGGYGYLKAYYAVRGFEGYENVTQMIVNYDYGCGLFSDKLVYCWGDEYENINEPNNFELEQISTIEFEHLKGGEDVVCGLTATGKAYCWGDNEMGQLGNGESLEAYQPQEVSGNHQFLDIAAGFHWTCGITQSELYCWGTEINWPNFTEDYVTEPVAYDTGGMVFSSIAGGVRHLCGINSENQSLYCLGSNRDGQLGDGSNSDSDLPVKVAIDKQFVKVDLDGNTTCGLTTQNELYCWGSNSQGQLGNGSWKDSAEPARVEGRYVDFSILNRVVCAVSEDSSVKCWGNSNMYLLGNNIMEDRNTPTPIKTP